MNRSWSVSRGRPNSGPSTSKISKKRPRWVALIAALAVPVAVLAAPIAQAGTVPPFSIDGNVPGPATPNPDYNQTLDDPEGNVKELGPLNSSTTKIGVIHSDSLPTLGLTNPNGQVDLRQAWLGSKKDGGGDDWLYFAWERDNNTGSGFIAYEFMQDPPPAACAYLSKTEQQLIDTCNPWANRKAGDFMILWDQQGGSKDLYLRTWSGTSPNLVLSPPGSPLNADVSAAAYSPDGFRGEAALNLTDAVFGGVQSCRSFANVIPSTVTGNSDSADYKDTILQPTVPVGGCTSTTVTTPKQSDGTTNIPAAGLSITTAGVVQVKDSAVVNVTGGSGTPGGTVQFSLCQASDTLTATCDSAATAIGSPVAVSTAFPATVVSPSAWVTSAGRYCWQASYSGVSASGIAGSSDASINECFVVIPVTPTTTTTASASVTVGQTVSDSATVTGLAPKPTSPVILTAAPSAGSRTAATGTVTFTLYGPNSCSTVAFGPVTSSINASGVATTPAPQYTATAPGTYSWKAVYNGDSPNNNASAIHNPTCAVAAEDVVVTKKSPAIATTATAQKVLGEKISDTATITGGYYPAGGPALGTVTFKLYGPLASDAVVSSSSCIDPATGITGNLLATYSNVATTAVSGSTTSITSTSPEYTPAAPGKYLWVASYSGNANNNAVAGTCGDANEASLITKAPSSLSTAQNLRPQDSVTVTATAGGDPTGTVTFKLFGPNNATCDPAGPAAVYTEADVALSGAGTAITSNGTFSISSASASQYKWLVSYSGDDNHLPIAGSCGSENFTLTINNGSAVTS